jgi:UDP-glucuronate 4-epimerase
MRVLVTGAAGFVGSHLCKMLAEDGFEILATDSLSDYYSVELKAARIDNLLDNRNINFIRGDLTNPSFVMEIMSVAKFDSVIHLAAQAGIRLNISKSSRYIYDNLVAFSNVAMNVSLLGIDKFLYASSSSVYGNSTALPYQETDLNINPVSIYGATKRANEILAPTYLKNTRSRGLRFFTVYGPWGRPDMAYFRAIEAALNGTTFEILGDGSIKRDFTFIDDNVRMIKLLVEELETKPIGFSDIVNIGGGNPRSLNELLTEIENQTGMTIAKIKSKPNENDTRFTCADTSYLTQLTNGFKPIVGLEEGIEKCIEWALNPEIRNRLNAWSNSVN